MNDCIVNVGFGGWHPTGSARLRRSLIEHGYPGAIQCWTNELPPGSPSHQDVPYGMKVYAMEWALTMGFQRVMWLDSSVWCIRYPEYHMQAMARDGYYLVHSGWDCDQWTNDECLAHFGLTREQARDIPMISAGILGLNFGTELAREFFARWKNAMHAGCFKGAWTNPAYVEGGEMRNRGHRHDQSCASIIAHGMGMTLQPKEVYDMYARAEMPETVEFALRGM